MTRIVLVDDHPIVRQGLRWLLEAEPDWSVVGEASDGLSAVELITELRPNIAILDLMMPNLSGLEVVRRVTQRVTETKVIVLSMHVDEPYVLEALRGGAAAYVIKGSNTANLIEAVRAVIAGRRYLSPPINERAIDAYVNRALQENQPADRYELLTVREREVLHMVAEGRTNTQIAQRLNISPRTVETHRANLMKKLGLETVSDVHRFAVDRGIIGNP